MKRFWLKSPLSKTIKMTKNWEYYFAGITIKQCGFGVIWRKKKKDICGCGYCNH